MESSIQQMPVLIDCSAARLEADLTVPADARGLVLFAHGSGSSRLSVRNRLVAETLQHDRIATLLLDLLSMEEEAEDRISGSLRFDIKLLAHRLVAATRCMREDPRTAGMDVGYYGSSTGAAAALVAAAEPGAGIAAVVSRGGRPDLAHAALRQVTAPTLLIVGELDQLVLRLNIQASLDLPCRKELIVVPGATHLFEEPGTLAQAARHASAWFQMHLEPQ